MVISTTLPARGNNAPSRSVPAIDLDQARAVTEFAYANRAWGTWPIKECGEPLALVAPRFCDPLYTNYWGFSDEPRIYVRRKVLAMFHVAHTYAQDEGYELKLLDGWRSVKVQEKLFWYYMRARTVPKFGMTDQFSGCVETGQIRDRFESLTEENREKLMRWNCNFISWPSKDRKRPSPHTTGGSIDVWLYKDGKQIDLGVPFDCMEETAGAFYHLKVPIDRQHFGNDDELVCARRTILLTAMLKAGFTAYPWEFWHWNFGNQMDAAVRNDGSAVYSYIEPSIKR